MAKVAEGRRVATSRAAALSLIHLSLLSCVSGALTGLLVAAFRISLRHFDIWRNELIAWSHGWPVFGFILLVTLVAAAAAGATLLVQRISPYAAGSGIPHVEAVAKGELPPAPLSQIPVKFIGGVMAIGGGMVLGREGPSVQMGADVGVFIGRIFGLSEKDCIALLAACGGAGIATAFNAPIAGAVFVLEELIRRFDTRIAIAALGSSCCAIAVVRAFLGRTPDFIVQPLAYPSGGSGFLFLALGVAAGLLGMAYNGLLLKCLAWASRIRVPIEGRAAVIGALIGGIAWFAPTLVGGGDTLTQRALSGDVDLALLPAVMALRFILGPVSYAAGTPGGLFAPMLVLGAQLGVAFAAACGVFSPHLGIPSATFAIVAMAAFFTAVVRAPVTGIVLVIELTASFTQLMPMLWACFAAMLIPTLCGVNPIYESLSTPAQQRERSGTD